MNKLKIIGEIGRDITSEQVGAKLNELEGDIVVEIDSPGGSVFEGVRIFNLLSQYKGKKIIVINSLAASMATYIAMAGDIIKAYENSTFMIHNAVGGVIGDYKDMQKMAEVLEGITALLAKKYIEKTGKNEKEIRDLMDKESWFFGEDIKEFGFVDEIIKNESNEDKQTALALSKEKFKAMLLHMKETEQKEEREKIAAYLKENVYKNKQNKEVIKKEYKMFAELEKAKFLLKTKENV